MRINSKTILAGMALGALLLTGCNDAEMLSKGIYETYRDRNLRYSQVVPFTMTEEKNTGTNLPAQIDIHATEGDEYKFLFVAKGGGSANKTYLYQETKAILNPKTLVPFLIEKMKTLGTAACPPYHIAFVIGGTSAEANLAAVKMMEDNEIRITTSQRSSVESRKNDMAGQVEAHFQLAGARVEHSDGYPGWAPNMESAIMKISADAYEELFGVKPAIKAIHAGLECGLFLSKYPNLDMVSFGPTMTGVHSPDEKLNIPTTEKFWRHLCRVLEKVAGL